MWATGRLGDEPLGRQAIWAMSHLGDAVWATGRLVDGLFGRCLLCNAMFKQGIVFLIFHFLRELFILSKFPLYAGVVLRSCDSLTTQCKALVFNRITLLEAEIAMLVSNVEFCA